MRTLSEQRKWEQRRLAERSEGWSRRIGPLEERVKHLAGNHEQRVVGYPGLVTDYHALAGLRAIRFGVHRRADLIRRHRIRPDGPDDLGRPQGTPGMQPFKVALGSRSRLRCRPSLAAASHCTPPRAAGHRGILHMLRARREPQGPALRRTSRLPVPTYPGPLSHG